MLWPNGSGLPWVRVWLWGGSPESSKFTTTSSNGRFSLTHGEGAFTLIVYIPDAEAYVGWYSEDSPGGFTTQRERATVFRLDGRYSTQIEIRLPVHPLQLPPAMSSDTAAGVPVPDASPTPTATPRPRPTPRPTPTPAAIPVYPEIVFVSDVPASRQAAYRAEMQDVVAYFAETHGVQAPAFSMVVGVNVEAVRSIYDDFGAGNSGTLSPGVRLARVRGDIDALFVSGTAVSAGPISYYPLVHNYFRVVRRDLSDLAYGTPIWLVDGSTTYAARIYADERKGASFNDARKNVIVWAASLDVPLKRLENYGVWETRTAAGRNAALLATEWLAREAGESSHVDYWRELATSATWEDAFSAAFGMTTDEFYTAFDEYARELFADLQRIGGTVLGPEGRPLRGIGVRAWHGGSTGSTTAETKADGTFVVRVRDGNYAIQIYTEPSSVLPFAGWWKDGGGLTAECHEAARVVIRGADATDLVIRLPAWERYSDLAPPGAVLMSTFSDFVRLTVQRKCPFGWSLMVDDAAPWHPGGPPARTYLLMVLREMPSSRAVARIESPCRRAC